MCKSFFRSSETQSGWRDYSPGLRRDRDLGLGWFKTWKRPLSDSWEQGFFVSRHFWKQVLIPTQRLRLPSVGVISVWGDSKHEKDRFQQLRSWNTGLFCFSCLWKQAFNAPQTKKTLPAKLTGLFHVLSGWRDSNSRLHAPQTCTLNLAELHPENDTQN